MYVGNPLIWRGALVPCAAAFQFGSGLSAFLSERASSVGAPTLPPMADEDAFAKSAYAGAAANPFKVLSEPRGTEPFFPTEPGAKKLQMLALRLRTARIAGETVYLVAENKVGTRMACGILPEDDFEPVLDRMLKHAGGDAERIRFSRESPDAEIRAIGGGVVRINNAEPLEVFGRIFHEKPAASFTSMQELDDFIVNALGSREPRAYSAFLSLLPPRPFAHLLPVLTGLLEAGDLFPLEFEARDYLLRAGFQREHIESMYSQRRKEQRARAAQFESQTKVAVPSIHNFEELRAAVSTVPEPLQQYVLSNFLEALDENVSERLLRTLLVPLLESGEPYVAQRTERILLEKGMTTEELNGLFSPERRARNEEAVARRHARLRFEELTTTHFESVRSLAGLREAVVRAPFYPHDYRPISAGQYFLRALDPHGDERMIETFVTPLLEDGDVGTAEEAATLLRKRGLSSEAIAQLFSEERRKANQEQEARRRAALRFEQRTGALPESIQTFKDLKDACAKTAIPGLSIFAYCDFLDAFPPDVPLRRLRALVQPLLSSSEFLIQEAARRAWDTRMEKGEALPPVLERVK